MRADPGPGLRAGTATEMPQGPSAGPEARMPAGESILQQKLLFKTGICPRGSLPYSQICHIRSLFYMCRVNICPKGTLFYNQICLINSCFINGLYCSGNQRIPLLHNKSSVWIA